MQLAALTADAHPPAEKSSPPAVSSPPENLLASLSLGFQLFARLFPAGVVDHGLGADVDAAATAVWNNTKKIKHFECPPSPPGMPPLRTDTRYMLKLCLSRGDVFTKRVTQEQIDKMTGLQQTFSSGRHKFVFMDSAAPAIAVMRRKLFDLKWFDPKLRRSEEEEGSVSLEDAAFFVRNFDQQGILDLFCSLRFDDEVARLWPGTGEAQQALIVPSDDFKKRVEATLSIIQRVNRRYGEGAAILLGSSTRARYIASVADPIREAWFFGETVQVALQRNPPMLPDVRECIEEGFKRHTHASLLDTILVIADSSTCKETYRIWRTIHPDVDLKSVLRVKNVDDEEEVIDAIWLMSTGVDDDRLPMDPCLYEETRALLRKGFAHTPLLERPSIEELLRCPSAAIEARESAELNRKNNGEVEETDCCCVQ